MGTPCEKCIDWGLPNYLILDAEYELQPAEESTTVCFRSRKQPLVLQTASQKKSDFTEGKKSK